LCAVLDVNQTRFHILLGKADWLPAAPAGSPPDTPDAEWDERDGSLRLRKEIFLFPKRSGESPPELSQRRGAACDRFGNFYWIHDDRKEIRFLPARREAAEHYWSAEDEEARGRTPRGPGSFFAPSSPAAPRTLEMAGLAVTRDHYLLVGLTHPPGFLLFDLHGGGPSLEFHWPAAVPFEPFDMASARSGGAWILDRRNRRLWRLDREFRVVAPASFAAGPAAEPDFRDVSGGAAAPRAERVAPEITDEMAVRLDGTSNPVAVEELPDGSVLLLDSPPTSAHSRLHRWNWERGLLSSRSLEHALAGALTDSGAADSVRGHDFVFLPAREEGGGEVAARLVIVGAEGNQAFAFEWQETSAEIKLELIREYFPLRLFSGKALAAGAERAFYDAGERWFPLAAQPRPRFAASAELVIPAAQASRAAEQPPVEAFDGKAPGCVWHRLLLEACIPPGSSVEVASRASDHMEPLLNDEVSWQQEPKLYLRSDGPEQPFFFARQPGNKDYTGTWELLLQRATGRFLQLRLTLRGTGRNTPRLRALRIHYPRFSYLKEYLPAAYGEDPVSFSFLDRYLANVEGMLTALEGKIQHVETLFDSRLVPAEYLDWLATWLGTALDEAWDEHRRRLFLKHAMQMFRERGTRRGLERALRLALDTCVDDSLFRDRACSAGPSAGGRSSCSPFGLRIVERFETRRLPGVLLGDPTAVQEPGAPLEAEAWSPKQVAELLRGRFREFLAEKYSSIEDLNRAWGTNHSDFSSASIRLPAIRPAQPGMAADWERFLKIGLRFAWAAARPECAELYRRFLARRYRTLAEYRTAHGLAGARAPAAWADVEPPSELPDSGAPLTDWLDFVSVVLPAEERAHQFSVLLPVPADADTLQHLARHQSRLELARCIARQEKPAHTDFDVKLYWAAFRIGEARVGQETVLGSGSRSLAMLLGHAALGAAHLAEAGPRAGGVRMLVGRDGPAESDAPRERNERLP
jgi:phage tail-like protein